MRKRHIKKLLNRRICPACRGELPNTQYVDLDLKVRYPELRCMRVLAVLRNNKWVIR